MNCRFCGQQLKEPFVSLGSTPLSNSYLTSEELHRMESFYPLDVYVCKRCFLAQLEEVVSPRSIFCSEYAYFSSFSESWLEHCNNYAQMMIRRFGFNRDSFVVEVASNDGCLLRYFKERNIPVLGIEPASNTAVVAEKNGIPTDIAFFDTSYAQQMTQCGKLVDLIIGNNVLAHNPNLNDFVEGLRIALKPEGVITMEFPHLLRLIEENQFDTIYHEHYSYFSFYTVRKLFDSHNLVLFDVEEIPTHGGSLRIYGKHKQDQSKVVTKNVENLLEKEESAGLLDLSTYYSFGEKIKKTKRRLLDFLIEVKNKKKMVVGYGAPAKGNTLLNYCGIGTDFLDYTVDRSPHKQNKFLPGTHIPIKHPDRVREDKPDYLLILPWNIKSEIMEQMAFIRGWGGRFVVPIPEVAVYE